MLPILGVIIGILVGMFLPYSLPVGYSIYIAVSILTALDTVFGGSVASLRGVFNFKLFITGFFGNLLIALALTFIGEQLGLPLYYAAIFVFGSRLFSNFAALRGLLIDKYSAKSQTTTKIN